MLRLNVSEEVESFRAQFQEWLGTNPPPSKPNSNSLEEFISCGRQWQEKLSAGRWLAVHWPEQFGGRGLRLVEEAVIQEELVRVGAPQILGLFGLTMVGPVLIQHGSQEQREKHLQKILSAKEIWCQGFSEPGAGSDLAAIKTKAEAVDGGFRVTGQKVWTSFAQIADWCFVLCRTSVEDKPHHGMSYLLIDMKSQGIETRALTQISGDSEFNEVFFDNVFVPKENVVGAIGDGWKIAISTLMYERVVLTFARQLQSEVILRSLLEKENSVSSTKTIAHHIAQSCAVRALAYEHLLAYAEGAKPGAEGSMDKLLWSESFQSICKTGFNSLLCDATAGEDEDLVHQYLYSRGRTIAAGTSEIQRNIIAERILELPKTR